MAQVDTWQGKIGTVGKGGKALPWEWIGIAGAAVGALILLVPKKKKA